MKSIEIELIRVEGEVRVDHDKIPKPLLNAIEAQRRRYPDILNTADYKAFDRLFEQENKCRVIYGSWQQRQPDRIIWPNANDYTMFLIKWSSE